MSQPHTKSKGMTMGVNFTHKIILVAMLMLPITLMGAVVEKYRSDDKLPIVDFIRIGFLSFVGKFPGHHAGGDERVKYMIETFGQPIKTERLKKEHWREPGFIRDHVIRSFNGVIIETSTETGGKPYSFEEIQVITLENPKYTLYKGIKIGMSFSNFAEILKVKKETY